MEDKHWTHDDELIERFILNRLNPEERNELEDHLRICEVCKQEVRTQQLLVAGIRRGGREAFKARLREKAELRPEKQVPWPHILSAAAVIVILLSVGIYNRWFEIQKATTDNDLAITSPQMRNEELEKKSDQLTEERQLTQPEPSSVISPQSEAAKPRDARQKELRRSEPKAKSIADQEMDEVESTAERHLVGKNAEGAASVLSQPAEAKGELSALADNASESLWIEGTILADLTLDKSLRSDDYVRKRRDAALSERKKQYRSAAQIQEVNVVLSQQNSSALPPVQQRLQQFNSGRKVMTRIEQVGEKTQITVYLDSTLNEKDLANATIETPRNDSLILNLANQRIGYKLPVGWNARLNATPVK